MILKNPDQQILKYYQLKQFLNHDHTDIVYWSAIRLGSGLECTHEIIEEATFDSDVDIAEAAKIEFAKVKLIRNKAVRFD